MARELAEQRRLCRSCGLDITQHARYTRWTKCSLCYWKDRFEHTETEESLRGTLGEIRTKLAANQQQLDEARVDAQRRRGELQAKATWWTKLFGFPSDDLLVQLDRNYNWLRDEAERLETQCRTVLDSIERAKKVKKRFLDAKTARAAAERREQLENQERQSFASAALANPEEEFDRNRFLIQSKDYRRGNAIDNYFRKRIAESVLKAFDDACVYCGCRADLTFDHYGLTKNEGGNFVLSSKNKDWIKINIVVMCRSCNSAKSQAHYLTFFGAETRQKVAESHKRLLTTLLQDSAFQKILKRWNK
ncbi:MAG: hypothetical protein NTW03_02000 [Verrucomicrobia bacterium]|nr:hypothetical protein [Verrucomicrobiota bacterium]